MVPPKEQDAQVAREFGDLQARTSALETSHIDMAKDIKEILKRTNRAFGMATLIWLCIPTALASIFTWLMMKSQP